MSEDAIFCPTEVIIGYLASHLYSFRLYPLWFQNTTEAHCGTPAGGAVGEPSRSEIHLKWIVQISNCFQLFLAPQYGFLALFFYTMMFQKMISWRHFGFFWVYLWPSWDWISRSHSLNRIKNIQHGILNNGIIGKVQKLF